MNIHLDSPFSGVERFALHVASPVEYRLLDKRWEDADGDFSKLLKEKGLPILNEASVWDNWDPHNSARIFIEGACVWDQQGRGLGGALTVNLRMTRQAFVYVGSDLRAVIVDLYRESLLEVIDYDEEFERFTSLANRLIQKFIVDYALFLNPPEDEV